MLYDTRSINAIVLAGGINRIILFEGYKPGYKGLLPFNGKPLIQYTLDALRQNPRVKRICIVGPIDKIRNAISTPTEYEFVNDGATLIENIHNGLKYFQESSVVLVLPSDLPLVMPHMIDDFLDACKQIETTYRSNIVWSMIPEKDFTGAYIQVKKGFNRFKDVSVCHGNLLLMTPALVENHQFSVRMDRIYKARKSSIRAALAVAPLVGLVYFLGVHLLRALTIRRFARIASSAFGVGLIPVIVDYPEIAVDIDEARDYRFIMEQLDRRTEPRHLSNAA